MRSQYRVCNGYADAPGGTCRWCASTTLLPDLSIEANVSAVALAETAKRRLLYQFEQIGFGWDSSTPTLSFRFPRDTDIESFFTGHRQGVITINLKEANPVHRERARVAFAEPQRTLIGHLRHEAAHYLWDCLVLTRCEDECAVVFGDHRQQDYTSSLERYYEEGGAADWRGRFISRYASSHPWEDFAETCAFYLDVDAVLGTAAHHGLCSAICEDFDDRLQQFMGLGIALNELTRSLGLIDPVPEVVGEPIIQKLRFIDGLFRPVG